MALTFCTNADKLALKNAIQENFTKLKDQQTLVLTQNANLVQNLMNLYINNTTNTGLLVKHEKVKSLYTNNVEPMLNSIAQSENTVGVVISKAQKMMTSNCYFLRQGVEFQLNNQCRENLGIIHANMWYLSVVYVILLILTVMLVLYARQNNKDAMHIYDVVMVREELRDEFSKIENYSFYGRDDDDRDADFKPQSPVIESDREYDNDDNDEDNKEQNVQNDDEAMDPVDDNQKVDGADDE